MAQNFLHYTITSTLEQHIASTTYLAAYDDRSTRTVVLKIFHKPTFSNASEQNIFLQESEKLTHLNHAHIVPMLEAGIQDEQAYIVSTYMPNGSLRIRLDRTYPQRLPFQQAMTIISQIGQALTYLHAHNLSHGQVKPEHILFDANGRSLLSDSAYFTKLAPWDKHNDNTSDTFRYLAPEQFGGELSALSDQYALCCVAYELLTGRAPFTLRDPQALEEQHKYQEPTPPRQIVSNLSPAIEQALLKGLAKDPAHRHVDIATLLTALQQVQSSIPGPDLPLPRSKRRTTSLVPPIPTAQPDNKLPDQQTAQPTETPKSPTQPPQIPPTSSASETEDPPQIIDNPNATIDTIFAPLFRATKPKIDLALASMSQDASADPLEELRHEMAPEDELLFDIDAYMVPFENKQEEVLPMAPAVFDISDELTLSIPPVRDQEETGAIFDKSLQDTTFDELLQHMAIEDEQVFTNTASAPIETSKQYAQDSQVPFAARTASSALAILSGWRATPMRTAAIVLAVLLMVGCLWTYNALAATSSTSSTLALLSNLTSPTPKATIDALGILSPTVSPTSVAYPTPTTVKKTPTSTPNATSTPILASIPTPTPTAASISSALDPTATSKPVVAAPPHPTPTPQPTIPLGQTIWLKSTANGDYIAANTNKASTPVLANATQAQAEEEFRVIDMGNNLIALQSVSNGRYASVKPIKTNDPIDVNISTIGVWEKFKWISVGNGALALLSDVTGDYVSVSTSTTGSPLYANVTSIGSGETFTWGLVN